MRTIEANLADREWPPLPGSPGDGLLEQPWLRIGPRDGEGRRAIRDRAGRLVGTCQPVRLPWWWRWLGEGWEVREAFERPLVFLAVPVPALAARRAVRDAEGELIGRAGRHQLSDRWGRQLLRARAVGAGGQFEGAAGEVVARWAAQGGEVVLEVNPAWASGPFERMLVLARALAE